MPSKRKRKRKHDAAQSVPPAPKPPPGVATAFGSLLQRAGLDRLRPPPRSAPPAVERERVASAGRVPARPAPSPGPSTRGPANTGAAEPELSQRERALLHRAYLGVERIERPKRDRVERPPRTVASGDAAAHRGEDDAARARLSGLVGGGVRFDVRWEDGFVQGLREGTSPRLLARLRGSGFAAEAELDLHGLRAADVERAVSEFVRAQQRRGRRYLLIISGKGQHSEGGVGVLGEALARALSEGGAAPLVLAFATAHARRGGQGAVAVLCK